MAVFTPVSNDDARTLLDQYDIGELVSLRGITAGIENTNYFLTTTQGEYVLTLFEVLTHEQLPFYIELMHYLAKQGLPIPQPQSLKGMDQRITTFHNKPTSIVTRLEGGYEPEPSPEHCRLAGATLARTHLAAADFTLQQPNLRGLEWWQKTAPTLLEFLTPAQQQLLTQVLNEQQGFANSAVYAALPKGPSHCDLFRDNVLFAGTYDTPVMGGFIDFYFAGCDRWLFDVAVSVNDWCIHRPTGSLQHDTLSAWLEGYHQVRPFTDAERDAWPTMLQAAALRFWISRLNDFYRPRPAQTLKPHDPKHFERILTERRTQPIPALP
ncbi:MAG TPA: homoserine kinase [Candidatus Paenalcaligenes intestinipullorum]|uniref:Homoserine kinase n=1 Tax=Candidatus Paenalcaligenes intestinipullorum TaxID=2838718 RepID=A0A9D2U9U8_9BURK|nr:homoserine kinase [Candidatus Paenalcaligenes intestinipullorum]